MSVDAKVTGPGDVRLGESDKHGAEIEAAFGVEVTVPATP